MNKDTFYEHVFYLFIYCNYLVIFINLNIILCFIYIYIYILYTLYINIYI